MNTIEIAGRTYTKASDVAKKFHYATDYIGQLCRSKKVDGQLVGRSWYVDIAPLEHYKKYGKKKNREKDLSLENKPVLVKSRLDVVAPPRKNFYKIVQNTADLRLSHSKDFESKYEQDEGALLPVLLKSREGESNTSFPVSISLAEAKEITVVTDEKSSIHLPFSELPSVSLTGEIAVTTLSADETSVSEIPPAPHFAAVPTPSSSRTGQPRALARKVAQDTPAASGGPDRTVIPSLVVTVISFTIAFFILSIGSVTVVNDSIVETYYVTQSASIVMAFSLLFY